MAGHPQSSPRGLFAKSRIDVGSQSITYNSTALIVPALRIGSLASYITANSTGIKIGAKYISCNSTGNTST